MSKRVQSRGGGLRQLTVHKGLPARCPHRLGVDAMALAWATRSASLLNRNVPKKLESEACHRARRKPWARRKEKRHHTRALSLGVCCHAGNTSKAGTPRCYLEKLKAQWVVAHQLVDAVQEQEKVGHQLKGQVRGHVAVVVEPGRQLRRMEPTRDAQRPRPRPVSLSLPPPLPLSLSFSPPPLFPYANQPCRGRALRAGKERISFSLLLWRRARARAGLCLDVSPDEAYGARESVNRRHQRRQSVGQTDGARTHRGTPGSGTPCQ